MAAEGDLDLVVLGLDKGSSATGAMFQYKGMARRFRPARSRLSLH